jgi:putative endonuclease
MRDRASHVYMMTNVERVLYIGVTSNIEMRVWQHKQLQIPGFTHQNKLTQLVYIEEFGDIRTAIEREKQLKGWRRAKKIRLIRNSNPTWRDLAHEWYSVRKL